MAAATQGKLTLLDKLNICRILTQAVIYALAKCTTALILPNKEYQDLGIIRRVYPSVIKYLFTITPPHYNKLLSTPTSTAITNYCIKQKLSHETEDLPLGGHLHWIGPKTCPKILLYFHGGGYNNPINAKAHIGFSLKMANSANASLVLLEYTLAPTATYPTQLRQASTALTHLLSTYPASNIILAGDSAGGHIAAGLLSHLNHPSPKIDKVNMKGKLAGICFISPFTSLDYDKASYVQNEKHDFLTLAAVKRYNSTFQNPLLKQEEALLDSCLSPGDAPKGWWEGVPAEKLIVVWGTWEVFADDDKIFGERLRGEVGGGTDVMVVECRREVHVGAVVDFGFGLDERDMAKAILAWMKGFQ